MYRGKEGSGALSPYPHPPAHIIDWHISTTAAGDTDTARTNMPWCKDKTQSAAARGWGRWVDGRAVAAATAATTAMAAAEAAAAGEEGGRREGGEGYRGVSAGVSHCGDG